MKNDNLMHINKLYNFGMDKKGIRDYIIGRREHAICNT